MAGAGLPAAWLDVRPIMVTDDRFGRATPYTQVLYTRARECLLPLAEAGRVPGHSGVHRGDGRRGRRPRSGGAARTSAPRCSVPRCRRQRVEIWTDVSGLMTADPRIVPGARTLAAASYEEAAELATFGAKVLHPATAMPLVRAGIPIVVLNSRRPEQPGTTIEPSAELERMGDSPIRSISWKRGITVINMRAPRMLGAYGFLRALFEVFERHEVVVDVLASGEVSVSLTVEDRTRLDPVVRELDDLGEVWVEDDRAIVAVVGIGLRHTPGPRGAGLPCGAAGQRGGDLPGRLGDQHDVRGAGGGRPGGGATAARGVLRVVLGDLARRGASCDDMRLLIVGDGKMGRAVAALAAGRGHRVHDRYGGRRTPRARRSTAERLHGATMSRSSSPAPTPLPPISSG